MSDTPNDSAADTPENSGPNSAAPHQRSAAPDGSQGPNAAAPHNEYPSAERAAQPWHQQPTQPQPTQQQTQPQTTQPTEPLGPRQAQPQPGQPQPTQPGQPQPWAAQPAYTPTAPVYPGQPNTPRGDYGGGAFGYPAPYTQQPGAGQQQPGGGQPYVGLDPRASGAPKQPRRLTAGPVIALLAIGALVGGIAGGSVAAGIAANSQGNTKFTSSGAANITVNDPKNATQITAVAAKASPSVVTISVTASNEAGSGSGVVLSSDGYVLTNTHVVTLDGDTSSVKLQVQDNNGKLYQAKVVGTDPVADLAVIKLAGASGMRPATFANSNKLNVGDSAVAIGAPLGLAGTVTNGIVSALNRSISIASSAAPKSGADDGGSSGNPFNFNFPGQQGQSSAKTTISVPVIQTDAAINPGNSGGALLNDKGQVIGINVAIASASSTSTSGAQSGSIGVGFAIPANYAERIAKDLTANGKATHGLLGATVGDASSVSGATTTGAVIKSITAGGAAASAGLQAGDIVTNFNGYPISDATDLTAQVRVIAGGGSAKLTYTRGSETNTVSVTLGTLPES